jgi:hypothetical protein
MTVSFSGMVATVGLPAPWGVVSSGGVIVRAHGTQTGMDTQTYSVNLAPLVPVSGSLTAYLAATVSTIQQGPFPVPGPPPGHPAYDPNYVPSVAYAATVYTVALAAVSGGIDNVNTFELLRTTLSAGQGAVTGWSTAGQARAADRDAWPATVLPSGGLLSPGEAQYMLLPATSGLTHTLPPASGAGGLMFGGVNPTVGPWTLAATGSDLIAGLGASGGASSLAVPPSGAALLWANAASGIWQLLASSPNMVPQEWTAGNVSSVSGAAVSGGVLTVAPQEWTAGNVSSTSGAVVSGTTLIAAPLAGSATQAFKVADATANDHAVAMGQFFWGGSQVSYDPATLLSTSVSFTPPCDGIVTATGVGSNQAALASFYWSLTTGATVLNNENAITGAAGTNCAVSTILLSVTAGVPVTLQLTITGAAGGLMTVGFNYLGVPSP